MQNLIDFPEKEFMGKTVSINPMDIIGKVRGYDPLYRMWRVIINTGSEYVTGDLGKWYSKDKFTAIEEEVLQ